MAAATLASCRTGTVSRYFRCHTEIGRRDRPQRALVWNIATRAGPSVSHCPWVRPVFLHPVTPCRCVESTAQEGTWQVSEPPRHLHPLIETYLLCARCLWHDHTMRGTAVGDRDLGTPITWWEWSYGRRHKKKKQ